MKNSTNLSKRHGLGKGQDKVFPVAFHRKPHKSSNSIGFAAKLRADDGNAARLGVIKALSQAFELRGRVADVATDVERNDPARCAEWHLISMRHCPKPVILHAVFFYVGYAASCRGLDEVMATRCQRCSRPLEPLPFGVACQSLSDDGVVKFSPSIVANAQARKRATAGSWRMDERYMKVRVQEHRFIKRITGPKQDFKAFRSATATIAGIDVVHVIRKHQFAADVLSAFHQVAAQSCPKVGLFQAPQKFAIQPHPVPPIPLAGRLQSTGEM